MPIDPNRSGRPRVAAALLLAAALGTAAGCHRPGGAAIAYTGASMTYYSTEMLPKTVRLVDLRTSDVVFSMDIPAGKQLTIDFVDGDGDDPASTPDAMRYEVFDIGTTTGKLNNQMSVPNAASRRIDVVLREGVEYIAVSPDRDLRTDELRERPDWWTAEGGALPDRYRGLGNYDD